MHTWFFFFFSSMLPLSPLKSQTIIVSSRGIKEPCDAILGYARYKVNMHARACDTYAPIVTLRVPTSLNHLRIDVKERAAISRKSQDTYRIRYRHSTKTKLDRTAILSYMQSSPLCRRVYVHTYTFIQYEHCINASHKKLVSQNLKLAQKKKKKKKKLKTYSSPSGQMPVVSSYLVQ